LSVHDLYGFADDDLPGIAKRVGDTLGITFIPHESWYLGGDYYRSGMPGEEEEFILQQNRELDDELAEPEFSQYPVLLRVGYIATSERSDTIRRLITTAMKGEAELLRRETL
jgi:hypothetical protein